MPWRAMVFGMFPTLCISISYLTGAAVKNAFQLAGLCWCEYGDFAEFGFSTLCFGRFAPTVLPNCRAVIQTKGD